MPTDDLTDTPSTPWVAHGSCTAEHEDFLIGNRAGLETLKRMVDDALVKGECQSEEGAIEFIGIRLVERDPRKETPAAFKDTAALWGCGLLSIVMITIFTAGLIQIWSWIR